MPVEIRELHIRVQVQNDVQAPRPAQGRADTHAAQADAIVAACVEQVVRIMKEKRDR